MVRILKLVISLAVRFWDWLGEAWWAVIGRARPATCVVLYYHAVSADQRAAFARQMEEVQRRAAPLPADYTGPLRLGRHHAVITFDDGFVSVLEHALPALVRCNLPATIFVPTGSLGGPPQWVKDPTAKAASQVVASADTLRRLRENPLILIGSHSISHPRFTGLDEPAVAREFRESKAELERILDRPVTLFSFPHGAYDERSLNQARAAGYTRVFTISPAMAFQQQPEFVTGRVLVDPDDWGLEFRLKLLGAYRWLVRQSMCAHASGG
jgi:peptidoglycan/xylan/chitin deacetylase (PgdA/CDA1 family)